MGQLLDFLTEHAVDDVTAEVPISPRFSDKNGNLLKFKIKAVTGRENSEYQKAATTLNAKKKSADFSISKYQELLIINHTADPDFKNAEAIKKVGCLTPEQFLYRSLLAGEISTLADAIGELSGFNIDMSELREEAKN